MAEKLTGQIIWNEAGKAGIALGMACISYMFFTSALSYMPQGTLMTFLKAILTFLLWLAKFSGCIMIMLFFMQKLAKDYPEAQNGGCYKLGVASSFLSALIVAAGNMAYLMFLDKGAVKETFTTVLSQYQSMLDSNSATMLESMMDKLPTITFFSQLIYCFLFGWVLSAVLSKLIQSNNPFNK